MNSENKAQYLNAVIENAIDGIVLISERGIIEDINQAGLKLFQYKKEELIGNNIKMLMPEPHQSAHDGYMHNYKSTGEAKIIGIGREVEGLKKDGTKFPFRLGVSEVKFPGKRVFSGVIHDLTEQKAAEERLKNHLEELEVKIAERTQELKKTNDSLRKEVEKQRETQQALKETKNLYENIALNFPNGTISVLDKDCCFLFIEGESLRKLGYGTEDLTGQKFTTMIQDSLKEDIEEKLGLVLQGEMQEFEISTADDVYDVKAVPLFGENGEINRVLVVETNITKQKQAEEEIYNALNKEKELGELKSRFVSMASHEFRTPLSTILSSASLIEKYTLEEHNPQRIKHTERIKTNVTNLNMILNDFLSLEKLESGNFRSRFEEFDLIEFMGEISQDFEVTKKPSQYIKCSCDKTRSMPIKTDRFLLQNIMNNLLSNAVKYSKDGTAIEIGVSRKGNNYCIKVKDEGRGISIEDQKQLFSRFFRASNSGTVQGTGLGLHIVKRYLDLLQGSISVQSELDKGSTFTILIPNQE
jgi:PAS domain S-box-containing protein